MESSLTVIDATVIVFTILSAILAMARGITREVLGVASFMGASFIATYQVDLFSPLLIASVDLYPLANKFSTNMNVIASWITGGILFIILWIIFTIITVKISRYINDTAVSGIDSFLGFIFGLVRGLFVLGIVYTMYTHFYPPEKYHDAVTKAQLKPVLDRTSKYITIIAEDLLPARIAQGLSKRPEANYNTPSAPSTNNVLENIIKSGQLPNNQTPEQILKQLEQNGISTDEIQNAIKSGKLPNNLTPEQILKQLQQ